MAFSVRCDFNRIYSYTDALKAWQGGIIFPRDRKLKKPDQIDPWSVPFVNRERAEHAFKETNYKDFRLWFRTYVQMSQPSLERRYLDNPATISMLRNRKWRELVARFGPGAWTRPVQTLHDIRHTIYVTYDCIEHKQVPFLGRG